MNPLTNRNTVDKVTHVVNLSESYWQRPGNSARVYCWDCRAGGMMRLTISALMEGWCCGGCPRVVVEGAWLRPGPLAQTEVEAAAARVVRRPAAQISPEDRKQAARVAAMSGALATYADSPTETPDREPPSTADFAMPGFATTAEDAPPSRRF